MINQITLYNNMLEGAVYNNVIQRYYKHRYDTDPVGGRQQAV